MLAARSKNLHVCSGTRAKEYRFTSNHRWRRSITLVGESESNVMPRDGQEDVHKPDLRR